MKKTKKQKKNKRFSHDRKIIVQVFDTLSSKFPQMITNLNEDTELVFTEKLNHI